MQLFQGLADLLQLDLRVSKTASQEFADRIFK